jgi:ATP-dependent RNA helicase DDX42
MHHNVYLVCRVAALLGGISKGDQWKTLRSQQHEIAVCTPGRLIDMIKMKAIKMNRVTFLVLDEADRMFDMGFEPQIRSIVGQIRPDRQSALLISVP